MSTDIPATVLLPPLGLAAPLDIGGEPGTPVLASQYRALAQIPAWSPTLLAALEAAMFRFYQDFGDPAHGDPVIERAADV